MTIINDDDPVRGLGFVALHAAYLEEQIDDLLHMLQSPEGFSEKEQRWHISQKIKKSKDLLNKFTFEYRDTLIKNLDESKKLLELRNEVIHGRIYAGVDRSDTLRTGRPNAPDREIEASELYNLANKLANMRSELYRPMILQIPDAIQIQKTLI